MPMGNMLEDLKGGYVSNKTARARKNSCKRTLQTKSFYKTVSYEELLRRTDKATLFVIRGKEMWLPRSTCAYIDSANKRVTVYKDFLKMKLKEAGI